MASPTNAEAIAAALAKPNNVPAGITQAYLEQNRDRPAVVAILFIAAFVTLILALRCYARLKIFGLDDCLALLTLLPYISFVTLSVVLIRLGSGRHIDYIEYVLDNSTTNMTEVLDFAAHILYTSALLICRLSGLAFYRRICDGYHKFIIIIRCATVFLILAYLPQLFLLIFHCRPVTGYWPYGWQAESNNYTCLEWGTVYVTNGGLSLVCDLLLFTIPAALISVLQANVRKKIKLSLVLFPGVFVIAISSARLYLVVRGQWETDQSWYYDPFLAIENAEIGSTLFALSVPAMKPLFGNLFSGLSSAFSTNFSASHRITPTYPSHTYRDEFEAGGGTTARSSSGGPSSGIRSAVRKGILNEEFEIYGMPQTEKGAEKREEESTTMMDAVAWENSSPESSHNNVSLTHWHSFAKDEVKNKARVVLSSSGMRRSGESMETILPKQGQMQAGKGGRVSGGERSHQASNQGILRTREVIITREDRLEDPAHERFGERNLF